MKVAIFDAHAFERHPIDSSNKAFGHDLTFYEARLKPTTAALAKGFPCVCAFVNDTLNQEVLEILSQGGTKLIALRSAGFNHVDLIAAKDLGLKVVRVPEYSPYSIAEHALALIQTLNRKTHKAYNRVREGNFSLNGLVGFDLHGKTVGVVGVGKIGRAFIRIMRGFGCEVLAFDLFQDKELAQKLDFKYVSLEEIFKQSDIISLHAPLNASTRHMIDEKALAQMKRGVMLINTSRGALIDTSDLIDALKNGLVGAAGLDVYEEEEHFFFQDHSNEVLDDDLLVRLMTFPNVVMTSHQAFLTHEALGNIASVTMENIAAFENNKPLANEVKLS